MDDRSKMMKMEYKKQQRREHILTCIRHNASFPYIYDFLRVKRQCTNQQLFRFIKIKSIV